MEYTPFTSTLFPAQLNSILTIPIDMQHDDVLLWPLTSTGKFTKTSTYQHLCSLTSSSIPSSFNTSF